LHIANAQTDFFEVYHQLNQISSRNPTNKAWTTFNVNDTTKFKELQKQSARFYTDSIFPLTKKVIGLSFPDINFTDVDNQSLSVSDFKEMDVIINYNYLFCSSCIGRIDSTLEKIKSKNIKLIVLFLENYKNEISDLKPYGNQVIIGFINPDTRDLISMNSGDNLMYYLNKHRQIEFFDKTSGNNHHQDWIKFLNERVNE
jgi:hypothetical protein